MPSWLVEDPATVYLLLGLVALGLGVAFWMTRSAKYLVGAAGALILILLVVLLDHLVVTDREKIVLVLQDMTVTANRHDTGGVFAHISESFDRKGMTKGHFRSLVEPRLPEVSHFIVWDVQPGKVSRAERKGEAVFLFKIRGTGGREEQLFYRCKAFFVLDPDDKWRLKDFKLFDPMKNPDSPDELPLPI